MIIARKDDAERTYYKGKELRDIVRKNYLVDPDDFREYSVLYCCHLGSEQHTIEEFLKALDNRNEHVREKKTAPYK